MLYVVDIYNKYVWVVPLKNKTNIIITVAFQKNLTKSGHKPNKILVDQGSEFYNRPMKLHDNDVERGAKHAMKESLLLLLNLFRHLKSKIYKHMTAVSKTLHINMLDEIVDEYLNLEESVMMEETAESRTLAKHISCDCRCEYDSKKYKWGQIWKSDKVLM